MKEINMLRFYRDYKVILATITKMLKENDIKLKDVTFKIENTTEGKKVAVHGYDAKRQARCRTCIKYEDLIEHLRTI